MRYILTIIYLVIVLILWILKLQTNNLEYFIFNNSYTCEATDDFNKIECTNKYLDNFEEKEYDFNPCMPYIIKKSGKNTMGVGDSNAYLKNYGGMLTLYEDINDNNDVTGFSVGIFTEGTIDLIQYSIGGDTLDGLGHFSDNGVFYISFDPAITLYDPIWVQVSIDGDLYTVYEFGAIDIIEEPLPADVQMGPNWIDETMYLAVYAPAQPVMKVIVTSPGVSGEESDAVVMKKSINL